MNCSLHQIKKWVFTGVWIAALLGVKYTSDVSWRSQTEEDPWIWEDSSESLWASLGGFRPLLASMIQLRSMTAFAEGDWSKVGDYHEQMTALQPSVSAYWRMGGWVMAVNGGIRTQEEESFLEKEARRYLFDRGVKLLRKGIEKNPDDLLVKVQLAEILNNPVMFPAFVEASYVYGASAEIAYRQGFKDIGDQYSRFSMYAKSRSGIESEERLAYQAAKELFEQSRSNHMPTLLCLLWVFQEKYEVESARFSLEEVFRTEAHAKRFLARYLNSAESLGYPVPRGVSEK